MRFGTFLKSVFYYNMDCQKTQKARLSSVRQWQRSSFLLQTHGESFIELLCVLTLSEASITFKMRKELHSVLNIAQSSLSLYLSEIASLLKIHIFTYCLFY